MNCQFPNVIFLSCLFFLTWSTFPELGLLAKLFHLFLFYNVSAASRNGVNSKSFFSCLKVIRQFAGLGWTWKFFFSRIDFLQVIILDAERILGTGRAKSASTTATGAPSADATLDASTHVSARRSTPPCPGGKVIKLFPSSLTQRKNKLECFSSAKIFRLRAGPHSGRLNHYPQILKLAKNGQEQTL